MASKPVTLREVARQANVSVATVSYVLSGKGRMATETRQNIERLLREAGIRPKHKRYPVFYISDHREFRDMHAFSPFLQLYDGLNTAFHDVEMNLRIEFLHMPNSGNLKSQLIRLLSYKPGGVILDTNLRDDLEDVGQFFEQQNIPAVQVGHIPRTARVDAIVVDSFGGAYKAATYFIRQGHKRIATIRWNVAGDPASSKKLAGFTCALGEAGIPLRPEYVVESPYTRQADQLPGRVAIEQLLALPEPPTAVFVENSFISPGLIYTAGPNEPELPARIRALDIIHFEAWHLDWMEQVMAGKLTYAPRNTKLLCINWEEMGRVAAKRLLTRLEGEATTGEVMQLVPQLYAVSGDTYTPLE